MIQKDPFTYLVEKGEVVRFEITPMNGAVGERVTAAVGGTGLPTFIALILKCN